MFVHAYAWKTLIPPMNKKGMDVTPGITSIPNEF
jgi:hypothetical protein